MMVPVVRRFGSPESERLAFLNVDMPQQLPAKGDFLLIWINEQKTAGVIVTHMVRNYDANGLMTDLIVAVE